MTPEEQKKLDDLKRDFDALSDRFYRVNLTTQSYFEKPVIVRKLLQLFGRIMSNKGIDIVAANNLALGEDGNSFKITGNTTINAIFASTWQPGAEVTLMFTGTPTVKHNTAGSAGTAKMFLSGSADLTAANNTVLTLIYDGTQWQEKSRKVA